MALRPAITVVMRATLHEIVLLGEVGPGEAETSTVPAEVDATTAGRRVICQEIAPSLVSLERVADLRKRREVAISAEVRVTSPEIAQVLASQEAKRFPATNVEKKVIFQGTVRVAPANQQEVATATTVERKVI